MDVVNYFQLNSRDVEFQLYFSLEPDVYLSPSLSLVSLSLSLLRCFVLFAFQCLLNNLLVKHHIEGFILILHHAHRKGSECLSHDKGLRSDESSRSHEHI